VQNQLLEECELKTILMLHLETNENY